MILLYTLQFNLPIQYNTNTMTNRGMVNVTLSISLKNNGTIHCTQIINNVITIFTSSCAHKNILILIYNNNKNFVYKMVLIIFKIHPNQGVYRQ